MAEKFPQGAAPQENKMGVLPIGRLLTNMAVPMMISMLVQACYNVVDSVFVAQISEDALNAVSLAFPLQNLMIAFGAGTAVGINALLSRSLGEKNQAMADRAANTGIFLALCNFALFALIGIFFSRTFFELQAGGEQVIIDYGVDYASICLGCSIGIFSQFCFERLLQSTGRTFLAMCTQLTGALINIVLDPILIFGWFGLPRMEVAGAAIATVAGQIVAAAAALVQMQSGHPHPAPGDPLARQGGGGDLPGGLPLHRHAVHRLRHGVRHEQDPLLLHQDGHRRVRRILQASELRLHAGVRPEQRHGAHRQL